MRVVVVIPALDEERSLPLVLAEIPRPPVDEVVVVDNGSRDGTARVARAAGATVVSEPRAGYGRACLAGLAYLAPAPPDIAVFLDADYSDRPRELPDLIEPILANRADLVIGSRVLGERERWALLPQARWGNWLATRLIQLLFHVKFTDLGPFRAVRFETLTALEMRDTDYGWTAEMQAKAARAGVRTVEVPVSYHRRVGRSKVTGTLRGTVLAGWKILSTIVRCRFAPPLARSSAPAMERSG
jgi:glycosyltransferase involved in cell wall biosynthesis